MPSSGVQMIVVPGSASRQLASQLAGILKVPLANVQTKRFPDGECYVRVMDNLRGREAVLVQNTHPDESIVELLLLQDVLWQAGISKLTLVVPYFGYARQDKLFNEGEAISANTIADHIQNGVDKVITVDVHSTRVLERFKVPTRNASAMPLIADYLRRVGTELLIAPDKGDVERIRHLSARFSIPWDHFEKKRLDGHTVEMRQKRVDCAGKRVAIVDDIISTGGTIVTAAQQLREQGAKDVMAACTHGLFVSGALEKLAHVCGRVLSTDTIESKVSNVSAAPAVAEVLTTS